MIAAAGTIGAGGALLAVGGIFLIFTILAALAECVEKADERRRRNQARAEARANRTKGASSSDAQDFSWWEPSSS